MDGPGRTSSDILGIEVGRGIVRGVRLDQETTELTAVSECVFDPSSIAADGIFDPSIVGPAVDALIHHLGVGDRSQVRVGMSIGPRNAGVGSGPSMAGWLEAQAANLRESMTCSGGLGIAFVPSRSIDAAIKLASGCGVELVRIDLAPVAGARAIGDQVEDLICLGSGRGWQARMRDFEVLEAMENVDIDLDAPLEIVGPHGPPRSILRYGWVEVSAELDQAQRLEIGQLAPAVGAAIGVAYESPANLLLGKEVGCGVVHHLPGARQANAGPPLQQPEPDAEQDAGLNLGHLAGYDLAGTGAEATLQLTPKADAGTRSVAAPPPQRAPRPDGKKRLPVERQKRVAPPQTGQTPAAPASAGRVAEAAAVEQLVGRPEEGEGMLFGRSSSNGNGSGSGNGSGAGVARRNGADPARQDARQGRSGGVSRKASPARRGSGATRGSDDGLGADVVDESDPITMFSPDTEVRHMMGKRESRLGPDVFFGLLLVSAIALLLAYLYV